MSFTRASIIGALFFCAPAFTASGPGCQPRQPPAWHNIARVFDGDTLLLANGKKVRFIGINTPERARDGRPAEPRAEAAYEEVKNLLQQGRGQIGLIEGREPRDRYGRVLAHVFLPELGNLSAHLLSRGLGSHIIVPPNMGYLDCYRRSEKLARKHKYGIWSQPDLTVIPAGELGTRTRGFRHVRGKITRVGKGRSNIWLNFGRHLAIRISRQDMDHFIDWRPEDMLGKTIEVRGWIYAARSQLRMQVRHPEMIRIIHFIDPHEKNVL